MPSDADYGVLSKRDREAMIAGARVEVAPYKRDPADFILWKPSGEGGDRLEFAVGARPAWLAHRMLGDVEATSWRTIDIHGGGLDLIFPHHENEIAQSRCAHAGVPFVASGCTTASSTWAREDVKSLGNIITPAELLDAGVTRGRRCGWLCCRRITVSR